MATKDGISFSARANDESNGGKVAVDGEYGIVAGGGGISVKSQRPVKSNIDELSIHGSHCIADAGAYRCEQKA